MDAAAQIERFIERSKAFAPIHPDDMLTLRRAHGRLMALKERLALDEALPDPDTGNSGSGTGQSRRRL